ncbi:MAG: protein translocase subunit SecF [Candidatus Falkowbacteria bacterium]|nr:protein translocase subunit SecF [Candidatus Falkowbacteria bacterium]
MVYKIIQKRRIFLSLSTLAVAASICALFFWGLNFGIDFTGGSLMEVEFTNYQPKITEIQDGLKDVNLHNLEIQPTESSIILRFKENSEEIHQQVAQKLRDLATKNNKNASAKELSFDSVGPSIGQELKSKSFNSTAIVFIVIILYISYAFRRVSKPVSSWKYGVAAIIALVHDVLFTLGVFSVLGHFYGIEVNTPFIAAVLTVLGYSVSDTIIVFDRIRENLPKSSLDFEGTVNTSVNQTITRSINTSMSAILALLAILFFGGATIKDFALALAIGIFIGTYSSIFIASPVLVVWEKIQAKRHK